MNSMNSLNIKHRFIKAVRNYFDDQQFCEVMAPPLVTSPGIEPHLQSFAVAAKYQPQQLFLHTSPEFYLKNVLSNYQQNVYSLGFSFRDEPTSENHRPQFLMLEWYRVSELPQAILQDCQKLLRHLYQVFNLNEQELVFTSRSVSALYREYVGFDFLETQNKIQWLTKIAQHCPSYLQSASELTEWEDFFFLLFLNLVEPELKKSKFLFVTDFPAQLAALSKLQDDRRLCHRFELYIDGLEVANCYQELISLSEQQERYHASKEQARRLYAKDLPPPEVLFSALEKGLPECSGIALGLDRLLKALGLTDQAFFDSV
jgi:lysyl-tRNA synthetase class 2